jgi:peptidoglycan/LPS O-acetylase OafA/YrhL
MAPDGSAESTLSRAPPPRVQHQADSPPVLKDEMKLSYIPQIDGLRALAILGVLFFHLDLPYCSLGWAGVELFFVLSGFLITRILLTTRLRPGYFSSFYVRRSLRIFPIYYVVIVGYALLGSGQYHHGVIPYYLTYTQTITQLRESFRDAPMLGHTWTLAIEEQFYLIWPMVILLVKGRRLLVILSAMFLGSIVARYALQGHLSPFLVDGWIGVQLDTFALGALLAYSSINYSPAQVQRWSSGAFVAGSAAIVALVLLVGLTPFWTPYHWAQAKYGPWVITIFAVTSAGATGMAATGHRFASWLRARPLISLGKTSYGVYLYHPFVFQAVHTLMSRMRRFPFQRPVTAVAGVLLTIFVAKVSWQIIEAPCLRLKDRLEFGARRRNIRTADVDV